MKRILILLMLSVLTLTACGSSQKDERTIQDFISVYTAEGIEVDAEEKPLFQLVTAGDGVIFHIEGDKVAIYEYEDAKALEKAKSEFDMMKEWPVNGKFILESDNEKAIEIFNGVTQ